jgi:hypothetical protein
MSVSTSQIKEAKSHLKTALIQVLPSDDKIIIDHMMQAYLALGGGLNDFLNERPFVEAGPSVQPQNTAAKEIYKLSDDLLIDNFHWSRTNEPIYDLFRAELVKRLNTRPAELKS